QPGRRLMASYTALVKDFLRKRSCRLGRRGKDGHEIRYSPLSITANSRLTTTSSRAISPTESSSRRESMKNHSDRGDVVRRSLARVMMLLAAVLVLVPRSARAGNDPIAEVKATIAEASPI